MAIILLYQRTLTHSLFLFSTYALSLYLLHCRCISKHKSSHSSQSPSTTGRISTSTTVAHCLKPFGHKSSRLSPSPVLLDHGSSSLQPLSQNSSSPQLLGHHQVVASTPQLDSSLSRLLGHQSPQHFSHLEFIA